MIATMSGRALVGMALTLVATQASCGGGSDTAVDSDAASVDAAAVDGAPIDATPIDATPIDAEPETVRVRVVVDGLWTGASLDLSLVSEALAESLVLSANGEAAFVSELETGREFAVTIASQPSGHTCEVIDGVGTVTASMAPVVVRCLGPDVDIRFGAPIDWAFDRSQTLHAIATSVLIQETSLTVSAAAGASITVNGVEAIDGVPGGPYALALGSNSFTVAVTIGDLSVVYHLVVDRGSRAVSQYTYTKASNTNAGDRFGVAVAIDGDTAVVGAQFESSDATGVDGDQSSNLAPQSGAVYVFRRVGATWQQEAYLKASNTERDDRFGIAVAISGDRIAVGATGEDSAATGVGGSQSDDNALGAGAVYVFHRSGTTWAQEAYIKATNTGSDDRFGAALALSGDLLAVGAPGEDSGATGIDMNQADNSAADAGAVYLYRRATDGWAPEAYVKASNTTAVDRFGADLALDGAVLVVGAREEDSAATGVDGDQLDEGAPFSGAAYVFERAGSTWHQAAYLKASNTDPGDSFGAQVDVDGDVIVIAAQHEDSAATGVGGNESDDTVENAGAVYVFRRLSGTWAQEAYLKASNTGLDDRFGGGDVAIVGDIVAVGAAAEDSASTGVDGDETNDPSSFYDSGALYLFVRDGNAWTQHAYIKASNTGQQDLFSASIALGPDALIVSSPLESSASSGVNGTQDDENATDSGAAYTFR